MKKKPTLSKTKKKAWAAFSLYIRHKYKIKRSGLIDCYTCSKKGRPVGDRFQAGHAIPGRTNSLLFMEDLVRPQCVACNYFAGGRFRVFTPKLIDEIGVEKYEKLAKEARKTVKYSVQDYLDIEAKYKKKLKKLTK